MCSRYHKLKSGVWEFPVAVWQSTSYQFCFARAAHATRLFFLIHPIRCLFYGVVVDANKLESLSKTTAKTTPENNDLIGSMGKNNLDSPATLNLVEFFEEVCKMKR